MIREGLKILFLLPLFMSLSSAESTFFDTPGAFIVGGQENISAQISPAGGPSSSWDTSLSHVEAVAASEFVPKEKSRDAYFLIGGVIVLLLLWWHSQNKVPRP